MSWKTNGDLIQIGDIDAKKWDFLEQEKRLWGNKFRCRKVFALNINIFQEESLLMYFDIIPCFLYLGITEMAEEW